MMVWEFTLLGCTLLGALLGGLAIYWARGGHHPSRVTWGQRLFIAVLLLQGSASLLAAIWRAYSLTPLGLCAGLLVCLMLLEMPRPLSESLLTEGEAR